MKKRKIKDKANERARGKKARQEGKLRCESGISVRSDIGFSLEKETSSYFPVLQLLLACASAVSVIFMLQSFFVNKGIMLEYPNADSACVTIFMTALSALMISRGKMFFKIAGGAYLLLNVFYIISNSDAAARGIMKIANEYSKAVPLEAVFFEGEMKLFKPEYMAVFLTTLAFVVTLLTSVACIFYVNFPILFLVTFPVFELGAFHEWMPALWTVVVMIVCWVTTLSISLINHSARRTSKSNFAVSLKKKTFYLTSSEIKQKFFGTHALTVIIASAAAFTVAFSFYAAKGNSRPDSFKELRRNITRRFGEITNDIANGTLGNHKIPGRTTMIGGTNGGYQLGSNNEVQFTGKIALKILCDDFTRPIYIRGSASEKYELEKSRYNWDPIRTDIKAKDVFGDMYYTLDYNFLKNNSFMASHYKEYFNMQTQTMRIVPVNPQPDLFYAPYGTYYSECSILKDSQQYFDGMISPSSQRQSYDVNMYAPDGIIPWDESIYFLEMLSQNGYYPDDYEGYTDIIYSNEDYFQVPDNLKPLLDEFINGAGISGSNDLTIAQIRNMLKNQFKELGFSYSTKNLFTPEKEDYIEYFLSGKTNKKGHCQFYASAAVMLMRELGYPARYVEGFLVEPVQFKNDKSWIDVTDRCAHAWCEVYIKGFGWYPIELTPGYEGINNPNLTDREKNITKNDSSSEDNSDESGTEDKNNSSKSSNPDKKDNKKDAATSANSSKAPKPVSGKKTGNNGGQGGEGEGIDPTGSQVTYFLIMIVFIVGFAAGIVVRRRHILNEINESINNSSGSKTVISCYTALLKYISLLGIKNDSSLTDVQLSSKITTQLGVMSPELNSIFVEISAPAITAYMSGSESDDQTAERSRKLFRAAQRTIFGRLSFFRRLSARWISGLY